MGVFCDRCGSKVEWHDTTEGRRIALDPEPHSDGNYAFDRRLKVERAPARSRARMYNAHFQTCPKKGEPPRRRAAVSCRQDGCERTDRHSHCLRCGDDSHWVAECPEAA